MLSIVIGLILLGGAFFYRSWEGKLVWNRGSWIGQTISAGPLVVSVAVGVALSLLGLEWYFAGVAGVALYGIVAKR